MNANTTESVKMTSAANANRAMLAKHPSKRAVFLGSLLFFIFIVAKGTIAPTIKAAKPIPKRGSNITYFTPEKPRDLMPPYQMQTKKTVIR